MLYRLKSAIVAVERSPSGTLITHIPCGSVVRIPDTPEKSGLIEILWEGKIISVFVQDVLDRGVRAATGMES